MANTTLSPLHRADGSAEWSKAGYSVIAAVNGPIEVQRRDELPEEAAVDVAVRPAAGVGGKTSASSLIREKVPIQIQGYGKGISNLSSKTPSATSY